MRSEGRSCLSVKSHLTYGAFVRPENAVTYSAGNEGQNFCGVFSETAPLQRSSTPSVVRPSVHSAAESTHAHHSMGLAPPSVFPSRRILPPLASLPLPRLAAQRNGGKRMCQSGLPADAASLRETGIVDRYTPPVGPCLIE